MLKISRKCKEIEFGCQTSKGTGHQNLPSNCVECRSRILQNLKIKTLVERGLVVAVEVYILRGQTLNWIPELQLCQIPTQTFYLNSNCEEQRFHNTNRNLHILFKTKLEMGAFFYRDRCCNWVSKCSVNTKEHFGKDITVAFMAATQIQQQTLKQFLPLSYSWHNLDYIIDPVKLAPILRDSACCTPSYRYFPLLLWSPTSVALLPSLSRLQRVFSSHISIYQMF